jgi:hypothetical protein
MKTGIRITAPQRSHTPDKIKKIAEHEAHTVFFLPKEAHTLDDEAISNEERKYQHK